MRVSGAGPSEAAGPEWLREGAAPGRQRDGDVKSGVKGGAAPASKPCKQKSRVVGSSWLPRAGVPRQPWHAAVACQPGIPAHSLSAPLKCLLCAGADLFSFLGGLPPKFPACSHC